MGYELHITRARFWAENKGQRIAKAEWSRLVDEDPELTIDAHNGPLFAEWGPTSTDNPSWFDWSEGNIYTKNPNRKAFAKMLHIADSLGASVQGDEGEVYATVDDYPESPDIAKTRDDSHAAGKRTLPGFLKREQFRNRLEYIIVGLVVLAYVLYDLAGG